MTAIIDYGVGNLFSLTCSFRHIGADITVTSDENIIRSADRIVLPGVGAFEDAANKLRANGLDKVLCEQAAKGVPILGICLGMQLLFERSFEYGEHKGLGLIKGDIVSFSGKLSESLQIPHIGWNSLEIRDSANPLYKYIKSGDFVYFVHSYFAPAETDAAATYTEYGIRFASSVTSGNIYGCQFHPEKSGDVGLNILRAFCETEGAVC